MSEATSSTNDPSMDDILASIRKIISDDEARALWTRIANLWLVERFLDSHVPPPSGPTPDHAPGGPAAGAGAASAT